ncbi:MAG: ORF6N domain-containing protein [Thermodesulfobacteriota bacterium]
MTKRLKEMDTKTDNHGRGSGGTRMRESELSVSVESIAMAILVVRGQRVMLDRDLARLYGVQTRVLNQAVRRNLKRFPSDFMFELSREEIRRISQTVTSSGIKFSKRVNAFTEQGVAMLSTVLNSERAIEVNIAIMSVFVRLREMMAAHKELATRLKELEGRIQDHDEQIVAIFEAIKQLMSPPETGRKKIGFEVKEPKARYRTARG